MNHLFIGPAWEELPPAVPKAACGLRLDHLPVGDTVTRNDGVSILARSSDCEKCLKVAMYTGKKSAS